MRELAFLRGDAPPDRCFVCGNPKVIQRKRVIEAPQGEAPVYEQRNKCPNCLTLYNAEQKPEHIPGHGTKRSHYWAREARGLPPVIRIAAPPEAIPRRRGVNFQKEALALSRQRAGELATYSGSGADRDFFGPLDTSLVVKGEREAAKVRATYPYHPETYYPRVEQFWPRPKPWPRSPF